MDHAKTDIRHKDAENALKVFTSQRVALTGSLKYHNALTTQCNKIYPPDGYCMSKEAVSHKNAALIIAYTAFEFGVVTYRGYQGLRTWIFGWE